MKKSDLKPALQGALTRLENKLYREAIEGKKPIRGFFEYIIVNLFALACLIYPLFVAYVIGTETAANDESLIIWMGVIGYAILEFGVVYGGVALAQAADKVNLIKPKKEEFWRGLEYMLRIGFGHVMRFTARLFVIVCTAALIIGTCLMAVNNQIMYGGWYYAEINEKQNSSVRQERVDIIDSRLERLQARYEFSASLDCYTIGSACTKGPRGTRAADDIDAEMSRLQAEKVAILDEISSTKGGGFDLLSDAIVFVAPQMGDKQVVTARFLVLGIVCVLGSILCIHLLSTSYFPPLSKYWADRKAWKARYGEEEFQKEVYIPQVSLTAAFYNLIGQGKAELATRINEAIIRRQELAQDSQAQVLSAQVSKPVQSEKLVQEDAQVSEHAQVSNLCISEDAQVSEAQVAHSKDTTGAPVIILTKEPNGVEALQHNGFDGSVDSDISVDLTSSAHLAHRNHTGNAQVSEDAQVSGSAQVSKPVQETCVESSENARLLKGKRQDKRGITQVSGSETQVKERKRGPKPDAEWDKLILKYVRAQYPDYEDMTPTGVMRAIKKVAREQAQVDAKGDKVARVGDHKIKRVYKKLIGKDYKAG